MVPADVCAEQSPAPRPASSGLGVLLVEDDDDIRFLLRFWLDDDARCAQVWETDGCAGAVTAVSDQPVDAILIDFMLNGGTADVCLPQLRSACPDARIVVYTANVRVARQAGVLDLGADMLVEKMAVVVEDVVDLVLARS